MHIPHANTHLDAHPKREVILVGVSGVGGEASDVRHRTEATSTLVGIYPCLAGGLTRYNKQMTNFILGFFSAVNKTTGTCLRASSFHASPSYLQQKSER